MLPELSTAQEARRATSKKEEKCVSPFAANVVRDWEGAGNAQPPFFFADRESFVRPHEVVNRVPPMHPNFINTKPFHSPKIPVSHHDLQISKLIVRFLANFAVIASCRSLNLPV